MQAVLLPNGGINLQITKQDYDLYLKSCERKRKDGTIYYVRMRRSDRPIWIKK